MKQKTEEHVEVEWTWRAGWSPINMASRGNERVLSIYNPT